VYDLIDKSEDIDSIKLKDLNDCKDELLRFSSVAEEQLDCVQRLEGGDAMSEGLDFTSPILKGALSVILSTAGSTERAIGRLEKRVTELQTKYEANQQDKINSRLNVLTIISAVALPLTLLTGFWGMNWEHGMPAIRTQYGFWYALAGMIALGFALLAFFYRAGWMDCNRI
jgi:magnesium transporter